MKKRMLSSGVALLFLASCLVLGHRAFTEEATEGKPPDHVMLQADDLVWMPGPDSLPTGAEMATLEGDMAKEGPFTVRMRVPAGYRVLPHTHPGVEHVTVMQGSLLMGIGGAFDEASMEKVPAGGFIVMQADAKHFAMTTEASIIQLHGLGPWGIRYVNPQDDPRAKNRPE